MNRRLVGAALLTYSVFNNSIASKIEYGISSPFVSDMRKESDVGRRSSLGPVGKLVTIDWCAIILLIHIIESREMLILETNSVIAG